MLRFEISIGKHEVLHPSGKVFHRAFHNYGSFQGPYIKGSADAREKQDLCFVHRRRASTLTRARNVHTYMYAYVVI